MNTYIITYDLRKQRDYNSLYEGIKSYWTWARILESTWAVKANGSAEDVFNFLNTFIDGDDGLFVIKSWSNAHWKNINCRHDWLKSNL